MQKKIGGRQGSRRGKGAMLKVVATSDRTNGSRSGFEQVFKNLDDVLWKEAGCTTELDYTEQSSWMLFLKYLDDLEQERALKAELAGKSYEYIIDEKHRWSTWAAPKKADGSLTMTTHSRATTS
jgi:type I restriction enzyme M protein